MAFVFEDEQPKSRFVFEDEAPKQEGVYEGLVKPTLKAAPRVAGATVGGLLAYPISGIAGLARLISTGDVNEAAKTVEGIQGVPGQLIETPEQAKSMEYIGYPMKPFEMAGKGWGMIGKATGIPYAEPVLGSVGEASAMFGLPAAIGKGRAAINKATDFKGLERPGEMPPETFTARGVESPEFKPGFTMKGEPYGRDFTMKKRFVWEEPDAPVFAKNKIKALPAPETTEPLKLPAPEEINNYFDQLTEQVGRMELTKEEKAQVKKAIDADRKAHLERQKAEVESNQTSQMDEAVGNVERWQFEDTKAEQAPVEKVVPEGVGTREKGKPEVLQPIRSKESQMGQETSWFPGVQNEMNLTTSPGEFAESGMPKRLDKTENLFRKQVNDNPIYETLNTIKRQGGIKIDSLSDYDPQTVKELVRRYPGLFKKEGKLSFDEAAVDHGFGDTESFMKQLGETPTKKVAEKQARDSFNTQYGDDLELAKEGYTPTRKVSADELDVGDEVLTRDDKYKVTGYTEDGGLILKDGTTITTGPEEILDVKGFKKAPDFTLTSGIDPTQTLAVLKSLKEKAGKSNVVRGIRQEIQSPERILGTEEAGAKIYKTADFYDQQKNKFLSKEATEFATAIKGLKEGSPESLNVGKALDGKIEFSQLNQREKVAFSFFKKKYDFLIKEAARAAAGTEASYLKALRAADLVKLERLKGEKREAFKEKLTSTMTPGEVEAFDILSRKISDYLPHIFDKEVLKQEFIAEIARLNEKIRTSANDASVKGFKERLAELEQAVIDIEGGKPIAYKRLPKNIRFRFFESRQGKEGYSFDAIKAYKTYLTGISRKIFDNPALQQMQAAAIDLSPELKPYAEWYMRRYMGMNKHPLDSLASGIASFQWMRTLGLNPRSALVNLTQRLNTIATVGEKYSLKGEKFGFTEEGKRLFDETGLAREIPNVLMEGDVSPHIEGIRKIVGFMFDKVEKGNRKHAFLSGYLKAKDMGMAEQAAIQYGIDTVHKTQFRYGRVGMPKALSSPLGRVAFQFSSYPIKQIEFLSDMARNNPAKFIKFLAYAEGGNLALQEFLDTDMSNAMGVGVTWAEVLNTFKDLSKGDIREASRHIRLAVNPGGGLLPAGLGPTATSIGKIASGVSEGKGVKALTKELTPVVYQRGEQAVQAVAGEKGGKYPIYNTEGHLTTNLDARQLLQRTIGPRTAQEYKEGKLQEQKASLNEERKQIMNEIVNAIVDKDYKTARALIGEHKLVPTKEQIEQEIYRRNLTRMQRGHLKKPGKVQAFEYQKEGRIY